MPLNADDLVEKSKEQRKAGRVEEALVSALAAVDAAPDNAEAWWQVALSRRDLGDTRNQIQALRKTTELAPGFPPAATDLGKALLAMGEVAEAKASFERSYDLDPEDLDTLEGLFKIYSREDDTDQDEKEMTVLCAIEAQAGLSSTGLMRLGILQFRNGHNREAIRCWVEAYKESRFQTSLFNLGLALSQEEISQEVDGIDLWRRTAELYPDYARPTEFIPKLLPGILERAGKARSEEETILPRAEWFTDYVNPFQLLDAPDDFDLEELDARMLLRLRKSLLHEIDLEDGALSWMPGLVIDRSRAIGICESLSSDEARSRHWRVFKDKPLLAFLSRGCHEHFLVSDAQPAMTFIDWEEEEEDFRDWLGERFASQFDRVLSSAIEQRKFVVLECILDGRRWVTAAQSDRCFENARRIVDRLLEPLRSAADLAEGTAPSLAEVAAITDDVAEILNLLPDAFRDQQDEAAILVRRIFISAANIHDDSELARDVLNLTERFRFKSTRIRQRLEDDQNDISDLISQQAKDEIRLKSGGELWEITRKGIRKGNEFIPANDVSSLCWGYSIRRDGSTSVFDFRFMAGSDDMRLIKLDWVTRGDGASARKTYTNLLNAAIQYLFPFVTSKIDTRIRNGERVAIGPCTVTTQGVEFKTKGWFSTTINVVPWNQIDVKLANGDLTVSDRRAPKTKVTFPVMEVPNASVLPYLTEMLGKKD